MRICIEDGAIVAYTQWEERDMIASLVGGKWSPVKRRWEYPLTPTVAHDVMSRLSQYVDGACIDVLIQAAQRFEMAARIAKGDKSITLRRPKANIPPWHHQLVSYNVAVNLLGLEPEDKEVFH